jgi:hypothetical protein
LLYFDKGAFPFYDVDIRMVATCRFSTGDAAVAAISDSTVFTVHHFSEGERRTLFTNSLHPGKKKAVRQMFLGQGSSQKMNDSLLSYYLGKTHFEGPGSALLF